jgi:hypothetical protein
MSNTESLTSVIVLLQAIPAIDYGKYIEGHQYWKFISDWIMLLFAIG